jgi:hypothetical protein
MGWDPTWKRGRSGRRRVRVLRAVGGSRRFAAVRGGCRETKKRASERIERRHAERKKRPRPVGAAFRETGGRSRRAPRHAGRGAETWRVRCPRARAVSSAPRAGARARGDARLARLAARLSSHARAAGRGQHVENQQCRGIRTSLTGDWGWVIVLVLEGHRVGRAGIAFNVLARRAVRVRAPVVGAGEGRAFDDFLPVLPPAVGVVAGHRGGGLTARAFSASGSSREEWAGALAAERMRGRDLVRHEADRGTRSEKCLTLVVIRRSLFGNEKSAHFRR